MEAVGEERDVDSYWLDGLSMLLSGINAASSKTVTRVPMAASFIMKGGDRFIFSHNFAELLLGQMEAMLSGDDVSFICRKCKDKNNKKTQWADVSSNDYIHRPEKLQAVCFAEQTIKYSKAYKLEKQSNEGDAKSDSSDDNEFELMVGEDHPGHGHAYMRKNGHCKIPHRVNTRRFYMPDKRS